MNRELVNLVERGPKRQSLSKLHESFLSASKDEITSGHAHSLNGFQFPM